MFKSDKTRGTRNASAQLTEAQVQVIRRRYAAGATQGSLARVYQVSLNTIGRIVRFETWTWLGDEQVVVDVDNLPPVSGEEIAASLARLNAKLPENMKLDLPNKEKADVKPDGPPREYTDPVTGKPIKLPY